MGCCGSKDAAGPKEYDPTPDPITGLTQKDRELIVNSWKVVGNRKCIKDNAAEFFLMLFATYPYLQNYFNLFKNKNLSELKNSPKMRVHAAAVFYFINSYVENIEDSEMLTGLIEKMATAHLGRGITVEDFENLRIVFLKFLPTIVPDLDPEIGEAWDKLLKTQNAVIIMMGEEASSGESGESGS